MIREFKSYSDIVWEVEYSNNIKEKSDYLLGDYYLDIPSQEKRNFYIKVINEKSNYISEILEFGKNIVIHNSKKTTIHEVGKYLDDGFVRKVYNMTTKTVYILNYLTKEIYLFNNDLNVLTKDYIRVVRDIVKNEIEYKGNGFLFHAASLESNNGKGLLLIGSKGSGKTTISLNLIKNEGFFEVSRDRTILKIKDKTLNAYGWPNYYNLTPRTLMDFIEDNEEYSKKYGKYSYEELDNLKEKIQMTSDELNIKRKKEYTNISHVFIINNKRMGKNNPGMILAENVYTPLDLNYPIWHNWNSNGSDEIRERAVTLSRNILQSDTSHYIEWDEPADAIEEIKRIINS